MEGKGLTAERLQTLIDARANAARMDAAAKLLQTCIFCTDDEDEAKAWTDDQGLPAGAV